MRLSVVTPSLNQAKYIEDTINSVLQQTHRDFEYIVVDGCSTDGSVDLINSYGKNIDRIVVEQDTGQANAINKGIGYASGEILSYLNSDDYYFRHTLSVVNDIFSNNPDYDVIYGDCVFVDTNGQFIRYFSEISDFNKDRLLNYSDFIMQPATFWRKRVFDQYGPFDENLHFGFDWAFWCELANRGCKIVRVPEILAANRVYDDTKTLSGSSARLSELKAINNRYRTRLLPHAYYRYVLADFVKKPRFSPRILTMPFYAMLSYGYLVHHIRNYRSKIIFGNLPKRPYMLKEAAIRLPRLRYTSIEIKLRAPASISQSVQVFSNGIHAGAYDFEEGNVTICLDISSDSNDVNVSLKFMHEYQKNANPLYRALFFYHPEYISAQVVSVVMS